MKLTLIGLARTLTFIGTSAILIATVILLIKYAPAVFGALLTVGAFLFVWNLMSVEEDHQVLKD